MDDWFANLLGAALIFILFMIGASFLILGIAEIIRAAGGC